MLAAGLEGIEKKYELPAPIEENVFEMTEGKKRKEASVPCLPALTKQSN
jgi:glutamine synthetase